MHTRFWIGFLLLAATSAFSQDCDKTVVDGARVLGGNAEAVEAKAQAITSQSGDVRVITLANLPGTLEQYVQFRKGVCPSWQSTNGGVKSNLVVLVVAPAARKFGVFYGTGWNGALNDNVATIKAQFMAPAFRDGDWARGLEQGEEQVGNRLKMFNEAALHPQTNKTIVQNQATDLTGLWEFLGFSAAALFLAFIAIALYRVRQKRNAERQEIEAAQQEAQQTAAEVADKISRVNASLKQSTALGVDVVATQRSVDLIAEQYARLAATISCSPGTEGLSARQYEGMTGMYRRLSDSLDRVGKTGPEVVASMPPKHSKWRTTSSTRYTPIKPEREEHSAQGTPSQTIVHNNTTYVDNGPAYIPVPVIVEELYYAPEPVHHSSYSPPADNSSSSFGGSSSSYDSGSSSFSEDSPSSSFDSGSSSDFGGSSSDF